jgi:hypothetical protein
MYVSACTSTKSVSVRGIVCRPWSKQDTVMGGHESPNYYYSLSVCHVDI